MVAVGKRAIVSLALREEAQRLAEVTTPVMKSYAEKIGADFELIVTEKVRAGHAKFEKYQLFDLLAQYQRICYLDCDILVMPESPDIFGAVDHERFGAFFDSEVKDNDADIPAWREEEIAFFQQVKGDIGWRNSYFNSGVMVMERRHQNLFDYRKELSPGKRCVDQTQINYDFQRLGIKGQNIGPRFNYLLALSRSPRQMRERFDGNYFLHYAGFATFYPERSLYEKVIEDRRFVYGF